MCLCEKNENIAEKLLSQLKDSMQSVLLYEISIKWIGVPDKDPEISEKFIPKKSFFRHKKPVNKKTINKQQNQEHKWFQYPKEIRPVFDGTQLVIFGIFPNT